jgi:hypothetical protein
MSSMVVGRYINVNSMYIRRGYRELSIVTTPILDHRYGHYVRPNMVAFKYLDFKKDVNPNVHVKVFNSTIKLNAWTSKEYIINLFNYMLKDIRLD